jgi:hypothetical protein
MRVGTVAVSWGGWGGVRFSRSPGLRLCLGWVAVYYWPLDLDDLVIAASDMRMALHQELVAPPGGPDVQAKRRATMRQAAKAFDQVVRPALHPQPGEVTDG